MSVFQSHAWQKAWWEVWGGTKGFELIGYSAPPAAGLYIDRYRYKGLLPVRCLQFVGTNYRRISTPRSEYNKLFSARTAEGLADCQGFHEFIAEPWSETVFRDMLAKSSEIEVLRRVAAEKNWLYRIVDEDTAYSIRSEGKWSDYLDALGRNTRLRLYNRRNILEQLGEIDLRNYWPNGVDEFFELLNDFHVLRWGNPCFNGQSLAFHKEFLSSVMDEGGFPDLSVLMCDGRPISVLYNVLYDGCVYNIQAGFIAEFHKKLSLGTLHLGYCIERAFESKEIVKFDMLAGMGKNENYKERLATDSELLISIMLVRSGIFKWLYRLKDARVHSPRIGKDDVGS